MKILKLLVLFLSISTFNFAQEASFHNSRFMAIVKSNVKLQLDDGNIQIVNKAVQNLNTSWKLEKIEQLIKSKPKNSKKNRPDTDRLLLFHFQNGIDILAAIEAYQSIGIFETIEPDFIGHGSGVEDLTPDDPLFYNRQWSLFNDGTFNADAVNGADVNMEAAWEITTGNPTTIIAILDSGFRLSHPEFNNRFWNNDADNPGNGTDDDANGYTDDEMGWDFVNEDNDPTDDHGHGTNVAGIMAATGNNGIGYAGINWQAQVMIGKILNSNNSGFYSDWTEAIYYAVDNGAEVINMSVGGSGFSASMQTACNYAHDNDVSIFVSMMNVNNSVPFYPSAYTSTIAVGATETNDERVDPFFWDVSSGSNYGGHIDLCAPGNFIYGLSSSSNSNYNSYWGGTSQASPIVAGVASLMKGLDPSLTVEEIRAILRSTADDQVGKASEDTQGWDQYHGAGRLNAHAALLATDNMVNTSDPRSKIAEIKLSPNPVSPNGTLSVEIILEERLELSLSLIDVTGRIFSSKEIDVNTRTFSLIAPAEAGIYFLKLETETGLSQVYKFIVSSK